MKLRRLLFPSILSLSLLFGLLYFKEDTHCTIKPPQKIERLSQILIASDVDGVIRYHADQGEIDPLIVRSLKKLLSKGVKIAFISGSPVFDNPAAEAWEEDNKGIGEMFYKHFKDEIDGQRMFVIGHMGSQFYKNPFYDVSVYYYSAEEIFNISKQLLEATLRSYAEYGCGIQQRNAENLLERLKLVEYSAVEPQRAHHLLREVAVFTKETIDSEFKLLNRLSEIEVQMKSKRFDIGEVTKRVDGSMGIIASGSMSRNDVPMAFAKISKLTKKDAASYFFKQFSEKGDTLHIAIGDGQVDIPLYEAADKAYHVGPEIERLPRGTMVVPDKLGNRPSYLDGTKKVLKSIEYWVKMDPELT